VVAPTAAVTTSAAGAAAANKTAFYASLGDQFMQYDVDIAGATLTLRSPITLPSNVQYCWVAAGKYFYIASSNQKPDTHFLNAFKIDPTSGVLTPHGQPVALPNRPINITMDPSSKYVLVAYNDTATVEVYRIKETGELGEKVTQPAPIDAGVYPHQVRVSLSGDTVITCGRGNDATATKPEDLGSLNVFSIKDGILTPKSKYIAPAGLGPRHLDFHPTKPWVYIAYERGNKLMMYTLQDGVLAKDPTFIKETLMDPTKDHRPRQIASAIHMDPSGKFLYVSNRCDATVKDEQSGQMVYAGGENTIVVYSINQTTGEPTLIQSIDTHGLFPRTFALDPSAKLLVAGNMTTKPVREGNTLSSIPNNLAVFKIGSDGKLEFARKYDFGNDKELFWTGFVGLGK
jgi:6-phosphogluconolactonase (cycloisomerase 2 family)